MSVTDPGPAPIEFDLGRAHDDASEQLNRARAQLEHLLPPAAFPMHLGYGTPPAGYRVVETWRVIPDRNSPRALMPSDLKVARGAVLAYNRLRPAKVALTRFAAGLGMTPLARIQGDSTTLKLSVPQQVSDNEVDDAVITRHLRRQVPGATHTAISLRDFHPRAKPTVQLLDDSGHVVAFAKVTSDAATGTRVSVEADLLAGLSTTRGADETRLRLPRVLRAGTCGPFTYSVVEPLPADVRRVSEKDWARTLRPLSLFAGALGAPRTVPLSATSLWQEIHHRVDVAQQAAAERPELVEALGTLADAVRDQDGDVEVLAGAYHGDWVPWNMAWAGSTLWVWDLEYGSTSGPIGLDAMRWHFQVRHSAHGDSFAEAIRVMSHRAPEVLPGLGISWRLAPVLTRLHVVDTVASGLELLAGGRGLPDGLAADAVDVMASVLPRPRA